jgi:hypothetical protein
MKILRWLLVVPVAVIGWYLGLIVAILLHMTGEHLCPAEEIVSGFCTAPWMAYVDDFAMALGSLLCGAMVVLFPTLVAPSHRGMVAVVAFVSALVVSAPFLIHGIWVPVAWATLAGGLTLWRIRARLALTSGGTQ